MNNGFSIAPLVAAMTGMYAGKDSCDGSGILFHKSYWAGLILATIASTLYTIGGLYWRFIDEAEFTCIVTFMLLIFNFGQYSSCSYVIMGHNLKHKLRASICSLIIALETFIPSLYFIFVDSRIYEYVSWKRVFVGYSTTMLVIFIVIAIIGLISIIASVSSLYDIRKNKSVK